MELVNKEVMLFLEELRETLNEGLKTSSNVLKYLSNYEIEKNELSEHSIIMGDFKEIKFNYLMFVIKIIQFRKKNYFTDLNSFLDLLEEFKKQQILMLNSFLSYNYEVISTEYEGNSLRMELLKIINKIDYCVQSLKTFQEFDYI